MDPTIRAQLDIIWDTESHKMNWLGMEEMLRKAILLSEPLDTFDEILAAYTGRGYTKDH